MFKSLNKTIVLTILFLGIAGFGGIALQIKKVSAGTETERIEIPEPDLANLNFDSAEMRVEKNGIAVRLINAHQNGDFFQVDVCYTLPDGRDWLLADRGTEVFLNVNGKFVYPVAEGIIDWIFTTDGTKTERCEFLLFPVIMDKGAVAKLTITQLSVSLPEIYDCPSIQKRLDEMKSGITVECYAGEGSSGINIVAKPAKMTEFDAGDLVHKIIVDARPGPWEFEINIPNP